jgi:hypothetical protein
MINYFVTDDHAEISQIVERIRTLGGEDRPRILTAADIWGPDSIIQYPTIWTDLDGVCNKFCGWTGQYEQYPPAEKLEYWLIELRKRCKTLFISTARSPEDLENVADWMVELKLGHLIDGITNYKLPSTLGFDDRVILFTGDYDQALREADSFKAHWDTGEKTGL